MSNVFGEQLRFNRIHRGVSLNELARLTGISQPYLSQIENGERNPPTLDKIISIADALHLDYKVLANKTGKYHFTTEGHMVESVDGAFDIVDILSVQKVLYNNKELTDNQKEKILKMINIMVN